MTKYKIVEVDYRWGEEVLTKYYVMWLGKKWYNFKDKWHYCREYTYASYDTYGGERVSRSTLEDAELYVTNMCKTLNKPKDIKIIECECNTQ
jgi:hypothetical protein